MLRSPHPPVFTDAAALHLFKDAAEVVQLVKTDLSTDLFGGFAGKAQFPLGMGDADI